MASELLWNVTVKNRSSSAPLVVPLLGVLDYFGLRGPGLNASWELVADRMGGLAFENRWLPKVLEWRWSNTAWRRLVENPWKPVAGRHLGERLFQLVDGDVGLWFTGLELLDDWQGSIPEWVEAVDALT